MNPTKIINSFTAGLFSLNNGATKVESRSNPKVSWVRLLEPMEKPSKRYYTLRPEGLAKGSYVLEFKASGFRKTMRFVKT